jgi:hypothetical protein
MSKTREYMPWYITGSALATIGCGLMRKFPFISTSVKSSYLSNIFITFQKKKPVSIHSDTNPAAVYGYEILIGASVRFYVVARLAVPQALASREDVYNAVALQSIGKYPPLY